jgi:uncharacterized protein
MNSLELAYTVSILRRLAESAFQYQNDCAWTEDLDKDIRDATCLIRAYDKRLEQQAKKEMLYEV